MAALAARATTRPERLPFPTRTPFILAAERASLLDIDLHAFEESEPRGRLAQHCEHALQLVDDTIREAATLTAAYDEASAPTCNVANADGVGEARRALRDIVDLAYLSGWTLHRKRASLLDAIGSRDVEKMASVGSSARRAVLKSSVAIERAIAACVGVPSELMRLVATDVELGLRTRALYRAFRADLRPHDPPDDATIESRLRAASIALVRVCEDPRHEDLRLHDRLLFHARRHDVAIWMSRLGRNEMTKEVASDGLRLWKDLAMFAECLRMINHRSELRSHDEVAARVALASLAACNDDAALEDAAIEALGPLLGRDDALDEVLLSRGRRQVGELRSALKRLG